MNHRKVQWAIVAMTAMAGTGAAAVAEAEDAGQQAQVTVQASHVKRKEIGVSESGAPIELIQLSRRVSYADLDLSSTQGAAVLDKRIEATARAACQQLKTLYPLEQWDTDTSTCVADAVRDAKKQAEVALMEARDRHGK